MVNSWKLKTEQAVHYAHPILRRFGYVMCLQCVPNRNLFSIYCVQTKCGSNLCKHNQISKVHAVESNFRALDLDKQYIHIMPVLFTTQLNVSDIAFFNVDWFVIFVLHFWQFGVPSTRRNFKYSVISVNLTHCNWTVHTVWLHLFVLCCFLFYNNIFPYAIDPDIRRDMPFDICDI